jgi:hypothetical protein
MSAITNTDKRSMTVINEEDLEESQLAVSMLMSSNPHAFHSSAHGNGGIGSHPTTTTSQRLTAKQNELSHASRNQNGHGLTSSNNKANHDTASPSNMSGLPVIEEA